MPKRKRRPQGTGSVRKRVLERPKKVIIDGEIVEIREVYDVAVRVPIGKGTDGREQYRTLRKRGLLSEREAEKMIPVLQVKGDQDPEIALPRVNGPKAVEYCYEYLASRRSLGEQREKVSANNYGLVRNHLAPLLGEIPLEALTTDSIQEIVEALSRRGLSARSVRGVMAILSGATKMAKKRKVLADDPYPGVVLPKVVETKKRALPTEKILEIIDAVSEESRPIVKFLAATGCRRSEAAAITWANVDLDAGELHFVESVHYIPGKRNRDGKIVLDKTPPKSKNSDRDHAIGPGLRRLLLVQMNDQKTRLEALGAKQTGRTPVFDNGVGGYRIPDSITKAWIRARTRAGHDEIELRWLRDHAATAMLRAAIDAKNAADSLGHDPEIMLKRYARPVSETERRAAGVKERAAGLEP